MNYTLIAVHGNGGGAFRFARMQPHVPPEMALHAVTLPGFADVPRDPKLTTLNDYAQVLHQMITPLPRPRVLLGTGIGGAIALEYAQQHGDELGGLILHAPVGTRLDTRLFPRLMRLPGMRRAGQWAFATPLLRPVWRRLLFHTPLPDAYVHRFFAEYGRCQVFGQMFDIITPDWFADLQPIEKPTALLWGERERILSADQIDDYKSLVPNHVVRIVPEWDHFPMIDTPAEFTSIVADLVKQLKAMAA